MVGVVEVGREVWVVLVPLHIPVPDSLGLLELGLLVGLVAAVGLCVLPQYSHTSTEAPTSTVILGMRAEFHSDLECMHTSAVLAWIRQASLIWRCMAFRCCWRNWMLNIFSLSGQVESWWCCMMCLASGLASSILPMAAQCSLDLVKRSLPLSPKYLALTSFSLHTVHSIW